MEWFGSYSDRAEVDEILVARRNGECLQLFEGGSGQFEGVQVAALFGQRVKRVELGDSLGRRLEHGVHQIARHVEETVGLQECKRFLRVSGGGERSGENRDIVTITPDRWIK